MNNQDPFKEKKLNQLKLSTYFLPVIGLIPALWTIYRRQGNRQEQAASRLCVALTLLWLIVYSLLWIGSTQTSELLTFRLLYTNTLFTSGYFVVCLALIISVWQGKSPRLPGIRRLANRLVSKD